jgi:hypothetical protein
MLQVAHAAVRDLVRSALGMERVYIPISAQAPAVAGMALTAEQMVAYYSKHPKEYLGGWQNKMPAAILFEATQYSPIDFLMDVTSPILVLGASQDTVCPTEALTNLRNSGHPQLAYRGFEVDHFAFYDNPSLGEAIEETIIFLKKHLFPEVSKQTPPRGFQDVAKAEAEAEEMEDEL